MTPVPGASALAPGAASRPGPNFVAAYERLLLWYLASLLFLYPYGVTVGGEASLRPTDLLALMAVVPACCALLVTGRFRLPPLVFGVIGAFLLFELALPFVGAVGYRHPGDAASTLRMALLWMPMVFLTMLAPSLRSIRFEERLSRLLVATLWINLGYSILQVATSLGYFPRTLLPTAWLEPWSVDANYRVFQGLRPSGFFANSTTLSVFGIVCLCFYYARYVATGSRAELVHVFLATAVVVLSTSRTAYIAGAAILFCGWWHLHGERKVVLAALVAAGVVAVLVTVEQTVGIDVAFSRIKRLADVGLFEDSSFGARVYQIWPAALEAARDYPFGTIAQPQRMLPLIDSGYLNYYLQGKWPFVAALAVLLAGLWLLGLRAFFGRASGRRGIVLLFLAIFLTGALVISNPLRSPLMIFFIVFSLWRLQAERGSVLMRSARVAPAAPGLANT
jgi:hypothetical protein